MDPEQTSQRVMSRILRVGVTISSVFMTAGLLIAAVHPSPVPLPERNPSLGELIRQLFSGQLTSMTGADAPTLMFTGLVLLMFTPFLRVVTTFFVFWKERDGRFMAIAIVVFLLLAAQVVYSLSQ
jgi:uncharacterized membrane protein